VFLADGRLGEVVVRAGVDAGAEQLEVLVGEASSYVVRLVVIEFVLVFRNLF
jgi:hypothetical protein